MCGLAGIFAYGVDAPPVRVPELLAMGDAMAARGPDGAGLWVGGERRAGFAHRRLAIIDLSDDGAQPMAFDPAGGNDPRYRIAYNGEIYNFEALRRDLESQGQVFQSESDTEVLLHLYHRYGRDMIGRLRGMFAFALWDDQRQGLLLARDPFGIKPLYYAAAAGTLRVASQVKALLAGGAVATDPDPAGHAGFFLMGSVPEPHTLYRAISALPAGTSLWVDGAGVGEPLPYFNVTDALACSAGQSSGQSSGTLRTALLDSVSHHLVADVPVGVFLSAGRDSATLTALASEIQGADLETMTLGFDEFRGRAEDETPLAEAVARHYRTRHRTEWVTGADFRDDLEGLLAAMDQPSIDGVNVYFVAKAAARLGLKVALSGLGGDELFCGYNTFRQVPALVTGINRLPDLGRFGSGLRQAMAKMAARFASPKYAGIFELGRHYGGAYLLHRGLFMPWELPQVLDPDLALDGLAALDLEGRLAVCHEPIDEPRRKIMALEMSFYMRNQLLRDADWAGMAHGLEIRVPFVDKVLFEVLLPTLGRPAGPDKAAMAATPDRALPDAVVARPKTGFGIPLSDGLLGEAPQGAPERGLRSWARRVYSAAVEA